METYWFTDCGMTYQCAIGGAVVSSDAEWNRWKAGPGAGLNTWKCVDGKRV